ncbi:MAG TPA: hypothetical protein VH593_07760, partial [Ktedonobacteraceae bacterium]
MGRNILRDWLRKRRKLIVLTLLGILLFSCVAGVISGIAVYLSLHAQSLQLEQSANAGITHLRSAESGLKQFQQSLFDESAVRYAREEFVQAYHDFYPLEAQLKGLPDAGTWIPYYGIRLRVAVHLVPVAAAMAQSGVNACDVVNFLLARLPHAAPSLALRLSPQDFTWVDSEISGMKASIASAVEEMRGIQTSDVSFDPHLAAVFTQLQNDLPQVQTWVDALNELLPVLPTLLGATTPTHYLIELLDSTELRPGGGFIGNYGIATFSHAGLTSATITDVDLLDQPFYASGQRIAYPPQYAWFSRYLASDSWSLRDSNLDADFP